MNILFLDQFSDLGGAQQCLLDLVPAAQGRGWGAHIAAPGAGALRDRALAIGASYRQIRSGPYESGGKSIGDMFHFAAETPVLAREIARLASECDARLIYVNGPRLLPAAALAAGHTPLVFHCHNYLGQRYASALAGISAAWSRATVIGCCRFVLQPLIPYLPRGQVHVAYNGVPLTRRSSPRATAHASRESGPAGANRSGKGTARIPVRGPHASAGP